MKRLTLKDFVLNYLKGVTAIIGKKGAGKTLSASVIAYIYYKYLSKYGYSVYANYHLSFPYIPIKKISTIKDAEKGLLVIDEAYQIVDSRRASSGKNVLITTLLSKARKKGIRVLFIAQYFTTLDVRIRDDADTIIIVSIYEIDEKKKMPKKLMWEVYIRNDLGELEFFNKFIVPVNEEMFKLYDSYEDIFDIEDDVTSKQNKSKRAKKRKV